jgi:hypothetical protein
MKNKKLHFLMYHLNFVVAVVVVVVVVVEIDLNLMYLAEIDSYQLNLNMHLKKDVAVAAVVEIGFVEQPIAGKEVIEKRLLMS